VIRSNLKPLTSASGMQLAGVQEGQRYLVSNVQPYIRPQGSRDQDWTATMRLATSRASVWKRLAPPCPLRQGCCLSSAFFPGSDPISLRHRPFLVGTNS